MKVISERPEFFVPISFTITIESKGELDSLAIAASKYNSLAELAKEVVKRGGKIQ